MLERSELYDSLIHNHGNAISPSLAILLRIPETVRPLRSEYGHSRITTAINSYPSISLRLRLFLSPPPSIHFLSFRNFRCQKISSSTASLSPQNIYVSSIRRSEKRYGNSPSLENSPDRKITGQRVSERRLSLSKAEQRHILEAICDSEYIFLLVVSSQS
jgi:hypothetical protein